MSPAKSDPAPFGTAPDGTPVRRVSIAAGGTTAYFLTWGARLQDLRRAGFDHPLVLGAQTMDAYVGSMLYYGAIVGPVANRIAGAQFVLHDKTYHLDANEDDKTTLHGGATGFGCRNWTLANITEDSVTFTLMHVDGSDGFPGNIDVAVTYALNDDGALQLTITGTTDRDTYFSPAFHGYWNLSGQDTIHDHRLTIAAETYLPIDADSIPIGAPTPVEGTVFDHRNAQHISGEVDHNYCLDMEAPVACTLATDALAMEVTTDQPGLQVYDAGRNDTTPHLGLMGAPYRPVSGVALEPQFWPDTPNQPTYPSNLLRAGETYRQVSCFRFIH